ncbi:MAG TPA: hypothetical protein VH682_09510 [Gemmataceae bacterium]
MFVICRVIHSGYGDHELDGVGGRIIGGEQQAVEEIGRSQQVGISDLQAPVAYYEDDAAGTLTDVFSGDLLVHVIDRPDAGQVDQPQSLSQERGRPEYTQPSDEGCQKACGVVPKVRHESRIADIPGPLVVRGGGLLLLPGELQDLSQARQPTRIFRPWVCTEPAIRAEE